MYKRTVYQTVFDRLNEPRRFIQVIMGPRQVGKSTVANQVLQDLHKPYLHYSADAVPATNLSWISDCWQAARLQMRAQQLAELILCIDEIQKIRNWSEMVKKEWDADSLNQVNIKVLLLGSSRVLLERGLSDSMMGRFEVIRMSHWTFPEMREAFDLSLEQFMYFGGYPGAAALLKNEQRWKEYIGSSIIDATINKDIIMDAPVNKPALLRQTFELGAAYSGKLLSLTKLLGVLQDAGNTVTLSGYLNLLNASGLLAGLQKFSMDMARRKASIPKFQVYNNALNTVYMNVEMKQIIADSARWGHVFESSVGAHILSQAFVHGYEAYYWRDGNLEVDFVLRKNGKVVGIEVKSNNDGNTKGLQAFKDRFTPSCTLVVGQNGLPVGDFLSMNPALLF
ncbi:MAG TPA: AAA family ATPase [Prevotella sp.]